MKPYNRVEVFECDGVLFRTHEQMIDHQVGKKLLSEFGGYNNAALSLGKVYSNPRTVYNILRKFYDNNS